MNLVHGEKPRAARLSRLFEKLLLRSSENLRSCSELKIIERYTVKIEELIQGLENVGVNAQTVVRRCNKCMTHMKCDIQETKTFACSNGSGAGPVL